MAVKETHTKSELEAIFANNFSTSTFPLLSELYLQDYDLLRARKVCKIGLKADPNNIDGKYVLAKIELLEDNVVKAERILKDILQKNSKPIKALKLFITVRDSLNRNMKGTKQFVEQLLDFIPDDTLGNSWLHTYNQIISSGHNKPSHTNTTFTVGKGISSLTFYTVLKEQKYYQQAEKILMILQSENKISHTLYKKEHKIITNLLK